MGFKIGDKVTVAARGYSGEVVDVLPSDTQTLYNVRYVLPNGRRPFYETWWPAADLVEAAPDET